MKHPLALALPLLAAAATFILAAGEKAETPGQWETVAAKGDPLKRHEHAFVRIGSKFYALGGRRVQSVDVFDPAENAWTSGEKPPLELHHFQALGWNGKVLVAGAFTGRFPAETPVAKFYFYDPLADSWSEGPEIPEARRRGSAGAFICDGKLYLVCGLTDGHRSGWVPWFDEYDFATGEWRQLPDAPRARDHFQAVLVGDRLVVAGGADRARAGASSPR